MAIAPLPRLRGRGRVGDVVAEFCEPLTAERRTENPTTNNSNRIMKVTKGHITPLLGDHNLWAACKYNLYVRINNKKKAYRKV